MSYFVLTIDSNVIS